MTEDQAGAVYDILVEHCEASEGPLARESFVIAMTGDSPPDEYRFCGALGFGGKFWRRRWGVSHYPEDWSVQREAMGLAAKVALFDLLGGWIDAGTHPPVAFARAR